HHFPSSADNFSLEASVVHLADRISHQIILNPDLNSAPSHYDQKAWDAVQLSESKHLPEIVEKTETQLEEVSQIFLQTF
ncbi:MAG: hypothetical protein HOH38_08450, partial [Nitrospinaceae bacterium]|nr:hypothetical protein [Nitrospinaceae bacterium]